MQSGTTPLAPVRLIRTEIRVEGNAEHTASGKVFVVPSPDLNTGEYDAWKCVMSGAYVELRAMKVFAASSPPSRSGLLLMSNRCTVRSTGCKTATGSSHFSPKPAR